MNPPRSASGAGPSGHAAARSALCGRRRRTGKALAPRQTLAAQARCEAEAKAEAGCAAAAGPATKGFGIPACTTGVS